MPSFGVTLVRRNVIGLDAILRICLEVYVRRFIFMFIALLLAGGLWLYYGTFANRRIGAPVAGPTKGGDSPTVDAKAAALAVRNSYVGKPLTLTGKTLDGKEFSTTSLKGKVTLVHFWASWCPDCHVELPDVIKLYQTYHDKGLEIVGVSSDLTAQDLRDFLAKTPEIPWTQLYTPPDSSGRHPLNTTYNVDWIPTVFILDQEGIVRSIHGHTDMSELVPKLLKG